jgi:putative endonuclease
VRWRVYIARCADGTLYTGISIDVERRACAHNAGRGAKYTRSRRPVKIVYVSVIMTKSSALREENRIKSLTRAAKLMIIKENS